MPKTALREPVNDADVERSAVGMIKMHGRSAPVLCQRQVEKMRRRKSQEGEEIWERILLAVLAQQPGGPILNFRDAKSLTARPLA